MADELLDADGEHRYHFSEDGSIERFVLRPAPSDPGRPLGVRTVDAFHAPLYWFPHRCPRVYLWAADAAGQRVMVDRFGTDAARMCAIESSWLDTVRTCTIHGYEFDPDSFVPDDSPGHFVSTSEVDVRRHVVLGDLLALHARSGVELRVTPRLGALTDLVLDAGLPFRFVNLRDARR